MHDLYIQVVSLEFFHSFTLCDVTYYLFKDVEELYEGWHPHAKLLSLHGLPSCLPFLLTFLKEDEQH